jgi:hypothetical protein
VQPGGPVFYTGLDQGLFSQELSPTVLPITVDPGHAERILVKAGVLVSPKAYTRLQETFKPGPVESVEALYRNLYRNGLDIHGLQVVQVAEGAFSFPQASKAPALAIVLHMASGQTISQVANWYPLAELERSR